MAPEKEPFQQAMPGRIHADWGENSEIEFGLM